MKGTWQTDGPGLGSLVFPVAAAVAVAVVAEAILSVIVWVAVAFGIVLALGAGGLAWWLRGAPKRKAQYAALYAAAFEAHRRPATVTATVIPPVSRGTASPVEQHVHYHVHLAAPGPVPARVIRVIPGDAGAAITEE